MADLGGYSIFHDHPSHKAAYALALKQGLEVILVEIGFLWAVIIIVSVLTANPQLEGLYCVVAVA